MPSTESVDEIKAMADQAQEKIAGSSQIKGNYTSESVDVFLTSLSLVPVIGEQVEKPSGQTTIPKVASQVYMVMVVLIGIAIQRGIFQEGDLEIIETPSSDDDLMVMAGMVDQALQNREFINMLTSEMKAQGTPAGPEREPMPPAEGEVEEEVEEEAKPEKTPDQTMEDGF